MIDKLLHSKRIKRILWIVMAVSFVILAISIGYPAARRAEKIDRLGQNALTGSQGLSTSLSYFAADDLKALIQEPNGGESYKNLCGLLTRVKDSSRFDRVYLLYKQNNKYYYLLDAGYRDNAVSGVDYYACGAEFTGVVQSKTKSVLDKVYNQKVSSDYSKDLITTADHREVVVSYTPVFDGSGQVMAVLAIESGASLAGGLPQSSASGFTQVAVFSGVIFFGCMLLLLTLRSWRKAREAKAAAREKAKEEPREQLPEKAELSQPQEPDWPGPEIFPPLSEDSQPGSPESGEADSSSEQSTSKENGDSSSPQP